jgi:hypothetical protein
MITPTARSITLPRRIKVLNSSMNRMGPSDGLGLAHYPTRVG